MVPQEKQTIEPSIAEEVTLSRMYDTRERTPSLRAVLTLAKHIRFIVGLVSTVTVISLIAVFFLPKYYTATAKILPPQQKQSIAVALLGQLAPLAALAGGKDLALHSQNDMYVAMLRSRTVADALVDRYSLMQLYREKTRVETRKELESKSEIVSGRDNIISISVEDKDPTRAANMANSYVEELEKLTRVLAVTDAGKKRLFFEREMRSASDELGKAEDALKSTQETTGLIQLDSQARVMLQAYADLRAQVTAKEVQLQSMRSFATADNPDLIRTQRELDALRSQVARFEQGPGRYNLALERVPTAGLEYIRRLREVKYRETLLELMTKQYEIARIDEAEGAGLIQMLDKALPPEKRSWPPRLVLVLVATMAALILAIAMAFGMETLQAAQEDPGFTAQWQLLKSYLGRRLKT